MLDRSVRFEGAVEPALTDRKVDRPIRLQEDEFLETVSRAVLREIRGGFLNNWIVIGGIFNDLMK